MTVIFVKLAAVGYLQVLSFLYVCIRKILTKERKSETKQGRIRLLGLFAVLATPLHDVKFV